MSGRAKQVGLTTSASGSWVQVERSAMERWSKLAITNPRASSLLHVITAQMGRHNALITSQANLARAAGCSVRTLQRSLDVLKEHHWVEIRHVGATGSVCAYIVNDRVAWTGKRDGIRYSLFSAAVLISDDEQPDRDQIGAQPALEHIPDMYPGERQLPTGAGIPAPFEPSLPGMEMDLPTTRAPKEGI